MPRAGRRAGVRHLCADEVRPDRDALKVFGACLVYDGVRAGAANDFAGRETFERLRQRLGAVAFTGILVALGPGRMEPRMRMTLRLALVTAVSLAAYLGLAIAGEGGFGRFLAHPQLTALVIITACARRGGAVHRGRSSVRACARTARTAG